MGVLFCVGDVRHDIDEGTLQTIMDDLVFGFLKGDNQKTGLQIVYPNRQYQPVQVSGFIGFFKDKLLEYK